MSSRAERRRQQKQRRGNHPAIRFPILPSSTLLDEQKSVETLQARAKSESDQGRYGEALAAYEAVCLIRPELAPFVSVARGDYLMACGRWNEAVVHYEQSVEKWPEDYRSRMKLGECLVVLGKLVSARYRLLEALDRIPIGPSEDRQALLCRLAEVDGRIGDASVAAAVWRTAADIHPGRDIPETAMTWRLSALALTMVEQSDAAAEAYEAALVLAPDDAQTKRSFAELLLKCGDYPRGFALYEARLAKPEAGRPVTRPAWDGSPLEGRTLLVYSEQGQGDTMQFVRFLPQVAAYGGRIVLECPAALRPVLKMCDGYDEIVSPILMESEAHYWNGPHDVQISLLSLPHLLGTHLEGLTNSPYLHAPADRLSRWQAKIGSGDALRVGLVWAGHSGHANDAARSMHLSDLTPLAAVPGVVFFSLQQGEHGREVTIAPPGMMLIDLASSLEDWGDTAAAVASLDLVISVDTAVCHLAGGIGRPVWTLLPTPGEWRWLRWREDSPWYPAMRLFRQSEPGNWETVVQQVADALRATADKHRLSGRH